MRQIRACLTAAAASLATVAALGCGVAQADSYFVNVAGLGGEPDYEQRFGALAADLDRITRPRARRPTW